jgi:hypothetical protein
LNVLAAKTNGNPAMLFLYAWAAAPYVTRVAIDRLSDVWNALQRVRL